MTDREARAKAWLFDKGISLEEIETAWSNAIKKDDREWGKDKEREITKKRKYEVFLSAAARRRYDCEDIVEKITDFITEIEEMSDALDEMKNMCRDISERCKKLGDYGDD